MSLLVWTWAPEVQAQDPSLEILTAVSSSSSLDLSNKNVSHVSKDLSLALRADPPGNRTVPHQAKPHTFLVPGGCTFWLQSGDVSVFVGFSENWANLCLFHPSGLKSPLHFQGWRSNPTPGVMGHSPWCNSHSSTADVLINPFNLRVVFGGFKSTPVPCCKHHTS